jgi:hypothetical protein
MGKVKVKPPLKIRDSKKTIKPLDGLIWDKTGSWYLETIDKTIANYRIYGGVNTGLKVYKPFIAWCFSGCLNLKVYKPFIAWCFSGCLNATIEKSFHTEVEAMKFTESNFDKDFYI